MANPYYTEMLTKEFSATLDILSQEKQKLLPHVWDKGSVTGEEVYWNQADAWELTFNRSRNAATSLTDPTYQRRRCTPVWATGAVPLDDIDKIKSIVDPKSTIAIQGVTAAARAKDKITWNALYGTAYTGVAGGTSTTFDSNMIVDVQESSTDVGLTVAKITEAIRLIETNSVDVEDEMNGLTLFISPQQKKDWLNIAVLTSHDYMSGQALQTGKLAGIGGIRNVIVSNMVPYCNTAETGANVDLSGADVAWSTGGAAIDVDSTSHRAVTLVAKSGVAFASWGENKVRVQERADLNNIWQFFIEIKAGATRMEEGKVALIECQE